MHFGNYNVNMDEKPTLEMQWAKSKWECEHYLGLLYTTYFLTSKDVTPASWRMALSTSWTVCMSAFLLANPSLQPISLAKSFGKRSSRLPAEN